MFKKNSYLISKALSNFMMASILTAVAQQLATTVDAIVVSHLIGPDAISAVNLVMPIVTLIICVGMLFGVGGSVVVARAIGRRDQEEADSVFSASMIASIVIGLMLSVVLCVLAPEIVALLCPADSRIYPLTVIYMRTLMLGISLQLVSFTLQNFVKTDGQPRLVMKAVIVSSVANLVLDIVLIQFFHMGIAGSAWATVASHLIAILICISHLRNPNRSFHFIVKWKRCWAHVTNCVAEGLPMSINTFLMALSIYAFNSMVLHAFGADGMYVWSICLQLFLIMQMVLGGIATSIYAIGGVLTGEGDMPGLTMLTRRVKGYVCALMVAIMLFVMTMPDVFGSLFGSNATNVGSLLHNALRIYALMLVPYAAIMVDRAVWQIIGYRNLSVISSVGQQIMMVLCVGLFALFAPHQLWWGFPVSTAIILLAMWLVSWNKHRQDANIALMTLIPNSVEGQVLNISIRLTETDVANAVNEVDGFLNSCEVDPVAAYRVNVCCEELIYNILGHAVDRDVDKHFIDLHIHCTEKEVSVLLKDDGKPFNPIIHYEKPEEGKEDEALGLRLVNSMGENMTYRYMYNQNMVHIKIERMNEP